ncbi:MAG: PEP-CTERM system histidine kinase PrsK [Desulfuromonadales bacterium]|nr:PEP-CTERM system histidine kinase PrsK [Desulfuromonadales bacterium]
MLGDIVLWSNVILCPLVAIALIVRNPHVVSNRLLFLALFFLSGLVFFDLQALHHPAQLLTWRKYGLIFETLVVFCCYYHTKTAFRDNSEIYKGAGFWISIAVAIALLAFVFLNPIENIIFSPDFADEHIVYLTQAGFFIYLVLMLFLVFGLVQLERTLAGSHQLQRWNIKPIAISSGLLLAAFALYFSHSLLYRSINMNYLEFRSVAVFIALTFSCYAHVRRNQGAKLALSRGIAHRSFVLLIVGSYLILLGVVGEGLRYFNIANAKMFFYVVLMVGSLGLAAVFLSEKLRRKLKVVIHKNFYQSKYDYREQWQNFADCVAAGTTVVEIQTSILDLFCDSLACKGGAFYLYDYESNSYLYTASFNFRRDWRPFLPTDPLIVELKQKNWIINLKTRLYDLDDSLIESIVNFGAFMVVPLFFDDELAGFIVLGEQINPDEELTYEDYDLLRMLARQAIATVQGLRLSEQLSTTRELAAIGKVSTFVLHDLKNQVSGLSLMLDNAREYIEDPEFQADMLETVGNTVTNMKGLIARLKNIKEKPELVIASVDLHAIVQDAVGTAGANVKMSGEPLQIAVDEEEIYKVVLNLLVNAVEATGTGLPVEVSYGQRNDFAFIEVKDFGSGMSTDFIEERLFRPFETTKKHGFGIGLYQCRQIVTAHGGDINVVSQEGQGTTFTVLLPLASSLT